MYAFPPSPFFSSKLMMSISLKAILLYTIISPVCVCVCLLVWFRFTEKPCCFYYGVRLLQLEPNQVQIFVKTACRDWFQQTKL